MTTHQPTVPPPPPIPEPSETPRQATGASSNRSPPRPRKPLSDRRVVAIAFAVIGLISGTTFGGWPGALIGLFLGFVGGYALAWIATFLFAFGIWS